MGGVIGAGGGGLRENLLERLGIRADFLATHSRVQHIKIQLLGSDNTVSPPERRVGE